MALDLEKEKVEEMTNKGLESWDNYVSGSFLKAVNVQDSAQAFVIIGISEVKSQDDEVRIRLSLERNDISWDFDLNKTNSKTLQEMGIKKPTDLIGKKIYFKKVLVRNPKTNLEVDGLRIEKIE